MVVSQCKEKFIRFISRYIDEAVDEDEQFDGMDVREPYYIQRLDEVRRMLGLGLLSLSFLGVFASLQRLVHAVSTVDVAEDEPWKTRLQKQKSEEESAALAEVRGSLLIGTLWTFNNSFILFFSLYPYSMISWFCRHCYLRTLPVPLFLLQLSPR